MTVWENTADGGSETGSAASPASTGGASGTPFDVVTTSNAMAITFSADDGGYEYKLDWGSFYEDALGLTWNLPDVFQVHGRFEVRIPNAPGTDQILFTVKKGDDYFGIGVTTAGNIALWGPQLIDAPVATGGLVPVGQTFRIEFAVYWSTGTNGQATAYLYPDAETLAYSSYVDTPIYWSDSAYFEQATAGSAPNPGYIGAVYYDNIQVNDQGDWPGPWVDPGGGDPGGPGANDDFANAVTVVIDTDGGTYQSPPVDFTGFGPQAGEVASGYHSAWWRYQPLSSGAAVFSTLGSDVAEDNTTPVDTILTLYEGTTLAGLVERAFNDDSTPHVTSEISYWVDQGATYYVCVTTYDEAATGRYLLTVTGPASEVVDLGNDITAPPADVYVNAPRPSRSMSGGLLTWRNTFIAAPVPEPVTIENSGGASGDPFDLVSNDGTLTYVDLDGSTRMRVDGTTVEGQASVTWSPTPNATILGGAFDLRVAQYPSAPLEIFAASAMFAIALTADGKLRTVLLIDDGGSPTFFTVTMTNSVGLNTWRRVEWWLDTTVTDDVNWGVRLYGTATATTHLEQSQGQAIWAEDYRPAGIGYISHGSPHIDDATYHLDNLAVNTTGAWVGPTGDGVGVNTAPAEVHVDAPTPTVEGLDQSVDAPTADGYGQAPVPLVQTGAGSLVDAPTADVYAQAVAPTLLDATITLISPTSALLVPTLRPAFKVAVATADSGARVEFQYATSTAFADGGILSAPVPYGQAITYVSAKVTDPLADGTSYVWRARVVNDFAETSWTTSQAFTISVLDGDAAAGGTWRVDATASPAPHLWWVVPDRGRPGDRAVAVGTALGVTDATVYIGYTAAPGTLYTVAPSVDAYTDERVIDRDNDRCDPGHQRVAFIVPVVNPPGGPLSVEGS